VRYPTRLPRSTKRTKEHRTTDEEIEGPTSFWGLENRKHAQPLTKMMMMMMMGRQFLRKL